MDRNTDADVSGSSKNKMVVVKIQGGIGNQMFQYALGRTLSERHGTELLLDLSHYKLASARVYELDNFRIRGRIATDAEIAKTKPKGLGLLLDSLWPTRNRRYIHDKETGFDASVLETSDNVYLDGYWQSERYLKEIAGTIRDELSLKESAFLKTPLMQNVTEKMTSENSVSVHIRRGDYLLNKNKNIFYVCPPEYYSEAIHIISEKVLKPAFFVFSDDISYAHTLSFPNGTTFVGQEYGLLPYQELVLMSFAKHNIIANSSFSWWGAWLNRNPNKMIVAPQHWFARKESADIIPERWIKI